MIRHMGLACMCCLLWAGACHGAPAEKILSGYAGVRLYDQSEPWRDYVRLVGMSGFNAIDLKVMPNDFSMTDPANVAMLERIAATVKSAIPAGTAGVPPASGLKLYLYLYPADNGKRTPEKALGAAFVDQEGRTREDLYCVYRPELWLRQYERLFFLADLSRRLTIAGVKMDIETITNTAPCLCDDCFGSYARSRGEAGPTGQTAERWAWVREQGGEAAYEQHLERRLEQCARAVEQKAHAANPALRLGFMPFTDNHFHRPWARFLATEQAPAIVDNWPMYTGVGYTQAVADECARVKTLNPRNLYVPWFRINTYRPADIAREALHAVAGTDGYNLWTLTMIHPSVVGQPPTELYGLPAGHRDPAEYWQALKQGNARIAEWLANPGTLSHQPLQPLIREVDLSGFVPPALAPVSGTVDVSPAPPAPFTMRGRNRLYLVAQGGQIALDLKHEAGEQRPHAISYGLVDSRGREVLRDLVGSGQTAQVRLALDRPSVLGLMVEASSGYQPWYRFTLVAGSAVVDAGERAYFFRQMPRMYFHVPADCQAFTITAETRDAAERVRLRVWTPEELLLERTVAGGAPLAVPLQPPTALRGRVWSLQLDAPEPMPEGCFSENYWITLEGVPPYLSPSAETLLTPVREP